VRRAAKLKTLFIIIYLNGKGKGRGATLAAKTRQASFANPIRW
jgi:hypothetical protein